MDGTLLGFAVFSLLLTVTPGADTALVIRAALAGGRAAGWGAVLGVCSGLLFHATLSALGLSVVLARSAALYEGVKLAGAAYLLYLGLRAWREARHTAQVPTTEGGALSLTGALLQGLTTNVLNPKVALFYLTVLPQFVLPEEDALPQALVLALIHFGWGVVWLGTLVLLMGTLASRLRTPRVRALLERLTGGAMVLLGLRVALDR
ncbi:LysE family translocator [Deinococcus sp. YIM 77859]|uniref:LysE family translocator n=1 Tax=Deinococcus sp. YIM 77859 TaxID=1540221 RepID=UPI000550AC80|nr:LysE family translocator [Deinococcus sp. YIM 77859]